MTFKEKLQYLIDRDNVSVPKLSEETAINSQTIYSILKRNGDKTKLSHLLKLCNFFECSLDYLVDDEITDPNYDKAVIDMASLYKNNNLLSQSEQTHIQNYRKLDNFGKEAVDMTLNHELKRVETIRANDELSSTTENDFLRGKQPNPF